MCGNPTKIIGLTHIELFKLLLHLLYLHLKARALCYLLFYKLNQSWILSLLASHQIIEFVCWWCLLVQVCAFVEIYIQHPVSRRQFTQKFCLNNALVHFVNDCQFWLLRMVIILHFYLFTVPNPPGNVTVTVKAETSMTIEWGDLISSCSEVITYKVNEIATV